MISSTFIVNLYFSSTEKKVKKNTTGTILQIACEYVNLSNCEASDFQHGCVATGDKLEERAGTET